MRPTLAEFLGYFIAALIVLLLIPIGIILMLGFTIIDGCARISGKFRRARP